MGNGEGMLTFSSGTRKFSFLRKVTMCKTRAYGVITQPDTYQSVSQERLVTDFVLSCGKIV